MYFDGSLMKAEAGAGLLFISPLGVHMRYMVRLHFTASTNTAEYEALVNDLQIAIELGVRRLDIWGDSQLVVDQVMKESNCLDPKMEAYCNMVRRLEDKFDGLKLNHIAQKDNEATTRALIPPNVFARDLHKPSIDYASVVEEDPSA
jgi:ribonuclease HI